MIQLQSKITLSTIRIIFGKGERERGSKLSKSETNRQLTLYTFAKNPSPSSSRIKSSMRVRAETACLSAWQEEVGCGEGEGDLSMEASSWNDTGSNLKEIIQKFGI